MDTDPSSKLIRICLTGGAGQISYSLIPWLCNGSIFGECPIQLHLLDIPPAMNALSGVKMEIQDSGFERVREVVVTISAEEAFQEVDVAILVGGFPRKQGMDRADLLAKNAAIMKQHGEAINQHAKRDVKVVVVANPANTNALMVAHFAPNIPKENITCLTRLDHLRLQGLLLEKLRAINPDRFASLGPEHIRNGIIWGNHSSSQVLDSNNVEILLDGTWTKACDFISDKEWLVGELMTTGQTRGAAIIKARQLSSAMSAAAAIKQHLISWLNGTPDGEHVSMGVISNGNPYGISEGMMYSFPVTCSSGTWQIVPDLTELHQEKMKTTEDELLEERNCVIGLLENPENIPVNSHLCAIS